MHCNADVNRLKGDHASIQCASDINLVSDKACGVAWPRPATAAESSAHGRGNAVGLTSIVDREQFSGK